MTARVTFTPTAVDGAARTGVASCADGRSYRTPCFMPVGTRGAVKYLDADDYERLGAQIVLANTYHLMLRPGAEVVQAVGGLGRFTGWDGLTLTDSGGFQVFSLDPKVDDDGVTFRSVYDGSSHRFTPEIAVDVQRAIGGSIAMVLDVCPPLPSEPEVIRLAVERTAAWATRARQHHTRAAQAQCGIAQAQFGIVQGGIDEVMRIESARRTVEVGFDGYGIGGLSVGESRADMLPALAAALAELPADQPRYLMGVGDPARMVEAVGLGVDQFDCVMQTRLGRHGTALTSTGRVNLKRAEFIRSDAPIDALCACAVCRRHSRGYLRHLFQVAEPTASRLATWHNLAWTFALCDDMATAITAGRFASFRAEVLAVWA